jgi:hypothetical protein
MYKVELIRFQPAPVKQEFSFSDVADVKKVAIQFDDETSIIAIADVRGNVCWGEFCVWRSAGRALVRLGEHREHFASYPDTSAVPPGEAPFLDDDGSEFHEANANTVSVYSAIEALMHWLSTGEKTSALQWS